MSTPKIIITKPGFDALTETDPKNMIFTSELASLKYYVEGSSPVSGGNGVTTVEITHGLGYVPFFVAYVGPIGGTDYCMVPYVFTTGFNFFLGSAWADSNKIYLQIEHDLGSTVNVTYYYKIFRNNLGL